MNGFNRRRYIKAVIIIICITIFLESCASLYKTSHQLFIDRMNDTVNLNMTIDELSSVSDRGAPVYGVLVDKLALPYGDVIYHYQLPNIFNRYCYYHFIVDGKTAKVKGWGFDPDKADPRANCGKSG